MKCLTFHTIFIFLSMFLLWSCSGGTGRSSDRISELMSEMTLEEKLGQLNVLVAPKGDVTGDVQSSDVLSKVRSGNVGGLFGLHDRVLLREWQRVAVEESRLGIPLLFGADIVHGYRTTFPVPIGLAATWNPSLMEESARIMASEASSDGITWLYAPMVDICRDGRWGRCVEGAGEDPYLSSVYASCIVRGIQGNLEDTDEILSCVKHFALYGASEAGRDYRETDMSLPRMYNEYFPPYKAAVDAGAASVMSSFNDVNGIPASGNRWLLTEVLRRQWGFDGAVVSDYNAVGELVRHGLGDLPEVSATALAAGVNMDMMSEGFIGTLRKQLESGRISIESVDEACCRVLEAKERLGLLDDPYRFFRNDTAVVYTPENRASARRIASESFVLLKNDGTLPLSSGSRIALVGPMAAAGAQYTGSWQGAAYPDCRSVLDVFRESGHNVVYARGSNLLDDAALEQAACRNRKYVRDQRSENELIREAVSAAMRSDVVVACVGEPAWMTGEASSRTLLDLPGPQHRLLAALASTGRPVVMLLFSGRPMTLEWEDARMSSILDVWYGGSEAADAILDVLYGIVSPSGKLPMTFPRNVGQIPLYYNMKSGGRPSRTDTWKRFTSSYMDSPNSPLYPFGYGLSYASFVYSDFRLSCDTLPSDGSRAVTATVTVRNTGAVPASETVQLYIRDVYSSMTRPVKELKGFRKVYLEAGESVDVSFEITTDMLSWYYISPSDSSCPVPTVEPGEFQIMVGGCSDAIQGLSLNVIPAGRNGQEEYGNNKKER